jgi:hypothetical protein
MKRAALSSIPMLEESYVYSLWKLFRRLWKKESELYEWMKKIDAIPPIYFDGSSIY